MNKHRLGLSQCSLLWPLGSCNNSRSDRINCLSFSDHWSDYQFWAQIRSDRHRRSHINFWDRSDRRSGSINFLLFTVRSPIWLYHRPLVTVQKRPLLNRLNSEWLKCHISSHEGCKSARASRRFFCTRMRVWPDTDPTRFRQVHWQVCMYKAQCNIIVFTVPSLFSPGPIRSPEWIGQ